MKPPVPTSDLSILEAWMYFDTVVDYYTDVLRQEIHEHDARKKLYEASYTLT